MDYKSFTLQVQEEMDGIFRNRIKMWRHLFIKCRRIMA